MACLAILPSGLAAQTDFYHTDACRPAGSEHAQDAVAGAATDSADVAMVVARYHRALREGDSATALSLLTSDAVVLESGGIETREEYRAHHLSSDIEFAKAVATIRGPITVTVAGDVAWASSTSTSEGQFRSRAVRSSGAELMVLSRTAEGWKIRAVHWSSRARRSPD